MIRDPRTDPRPGDALLRPDWGPVGLGGVKFRVCKVGPHKTHGTQVVCYLEGADGRKVSHSTRCYGLPFWPAMMARALVCAKAGTDE